MKKLQFAAFTLAFLFVFTACGLGSGKNEVIRYDIAQGSDNLDPQFATDDTSRMIIGNIFEGLYRQLPSGEIVPAIAKEYTTSADQLVYIFYLRDDAYWSNDEPVTAHDFAFGLRRMFGKEAFSPYAGDLVSIKNARKVLAGECANTELGIRAIDNFTLEITLERPDNLLEILCSSYAMPCNEAFFNTTQARYAMNSKTLLVNGPFYISNWNNKRMISLRPNTHYQSPEPTLCAGVDLYIPSQMKQDTKPTDNTSYEPVDRFFAGSTDACKITYTYVEEVDRIGGSYTAYEDTVWVLVLNQQLDYFANENMRKALAYSIDRNLLNNAYLSDNLRVTPTLVPPAIGAGDQSYRDFAGENNPVSFDPALARSYYDTALGELGLSQIPLKEILVADSDNQTLLAGYVHQGFQRHLSFAAGFVELPKEDLMQRVLSGDFEAAIIPLSAAYSSPEAVYSYYLDEGAQNICGYQNEQISEQLSAALIKDRTGKNQIYKEVEAKLLGDAIAIPLYYETAYYAMRKNVIDLSFSPFLSGVYFKFATKK